MRLYIVLLITILFIYACHGLDPTVKGPQGPPGYAYHVFMDEFGNKKFEHVPNYSLHHLLRLDERTLNKTLDIILKRKPNLETLKRIQLWYSELGTFMENLGSFYQQYDEYVESLEN
eukprot:TRINITY_DN4608_c0_g1_i1.p1 TRINITY_DN4608_c0_g1~~TRINITY_DN4608_c0_g1_i1.p1  ORF type:complete len:117 (-),score=14.82 TRINITY_DN4608_c0_g1_i1:106-456(-)